MWLWLHTVVFVLPILCQIWLSRCQRLSSSAKLAQLAKTLVRSWMIVPGFHASQRSCHAPTCNPCVGTCRSWSCWRTYADMHAYQVSVQAYTR